MIASGSDKVFVQADVALLPAFFVRNPGWWPMFDFDPEMAVQARRKVYDMLVARKAGKEATTTRSAPSPGGDGLKKGGCHPPGRGGDRFLL